MCYSRYCRICLVMLLFGVVSPAMAQPSIPSSEPRLCRQLYEQRHDSLLWYGKDSVHVALRQTLIHWLDSASYLALDDGHYYASALRNYVMRFPSDSAAIRKTDRCFTDAAISFAIDLHTGMGVHKMIGWDEISAKRKESSTAFIVSELAAITTANTLSDFFQAIQPNSPPYRSLQAALCKALPGREQEHVKELYAALNIIRRLVSLQLDSCIVVNIATGRLSYLRHDSTLLSMKVVAGKPSTPTPLFFAWCDEVVLYPYWNVPRNIAVNEFLPMFKKNRGMVDLLKLQVIGDNGKILNHRKIQWGNYSRSYFPFRLRQSTGCDNALGMLKFNLTDPYNVYMHDTPFKLAFSSPERYFSHGCIRLEKPNILANMLLATPIDSSLLSSAIHDEPPANYLLPAPVPVLVVYVTATVDKNGLVLYEKDAYHLFRQK